MVDGGQLEQVCMNMIINAGQAMPEGGTLTITTKKLDNNCVQIEIKDTGNGIPQEIKEKIFDPFFTTKGRSRGTGLGLSISYGIIKNHGGHIEVDSHPREGTTFTITLPVEDKTQINKREQNI